MTPSSQPDLILGIDPGFSGAVAWYHSTERRLLQVSMLPIIATNQKVFTNGGSERPEINFPLFAAMVGAHAGRTLFAVVEKVGASPKMGVVSAFRFGEGFGGVCGVLSALGIRIHFVYPSAWKAGLGLSSNKADSLNLAGKLFPELQEKMAGGKKSYDKAEAALLAQYGTRFLPNQK